MSLLKKSLIISGMSLLASIAIGFTSPSVSHADTLVIKNTGQFYSDQKPKKGMSKAQVRKTYGEPMQTSPAVGQPPITRWKFAEFTVYFEYNHVIHAVNNNRARSR